MLDHKVEIVYIHTYIHVHIQSCICNIALTVWDWLSQIDWDRHSHAWRVNYLAARPNNVTGAAQPHPPRFHFFTLLAVGLWSNGNESSIRTRWWILLHWHQCRDETAYWNEGWEDGTQGEGDGRGQLPAEHSIQVHFHWMNCLPSLTSDEKGSSPVLPKILKKKKKKVSLNWFDLFPEVIHTYDSCMSNDIQCLVKWIRKATIFHSCLWSFCPSIYIFFLQTSLKGCWNVWRHMAANVSLLMQKLQGSKTDSGPCMHQLIFLQRPLAPLTSWAEIALIALPQLEKGGRTEARENISNAFTHFLEGSREI